MNITQVKIFPLENSKVKAMASITLDGDFVITGLKILEGSKGLFVSMPSKETGKTDANGKKEYKDICFPVTAEARQIISDAVLTEYDGKHQSNNPLPDDSDDELPF